MQAGRRHRVARMGEDVGMRDRAVAVARRRRMRTYLQTLPARPTVLDRLVRTMVSVGFAAVGWKVSADGLDRLPRDGSGRVVPCVIAAAPHRAWMDPFLLLLAWPGDAPRLAWFGDQRTMERSWWRRLLIPRLGVIPIPSRATAATVEEHLADARMVLGRGCCVVIHPEKGPPSPRGKTRRIAPGAAWLAAAGRVPLVPVAIGGALEAGLGTRYRVRFLAPLGGQTASSDAADGRRAARVVTARLEEALAPAVAEIEATTLAENGRRPLPALRDLFH